MCERRADIIFRVSPPKKIFAPLFSFSFEDCAISHPLASTMSETEPGSPGPVINKPAPSAASPQVQLKVDQTSADQNNIDTGVVDDTTKPNNENATSIPPIASHRQQRLQ